MVYCNKIDNKSAHGKINYEVSTLLKIENLVTLILLSKRNLTLKLLILNMSSMHLIKLKRSLMHQKTLLIS